MHYLIEQTVCTPKMADGRLVRGFVPLKPHFEKEGMNMTDTKKPNRKRKIPKRIWLNEKEECELKSEKSWRFSIGACPIAHTGI